MGLGFDDLLAKGVGLVGKLLAQLLEEVALVAFLDVAESVDILVVQGDDFLHERLELGVVGIGTHTECHTVGEEFASDDGYRYLELLSVCHNIVE